METCVPLRRDMLANPIDIRVDDPALDFAAAKKIADEAARRLSSEATLLAWFDRKEGAFSPVWGCSGRAKPSWLVYAESRGGNIVIDINDEAYVFVYLG